MRPLDATAGFVRTEALTRVIESPAEVVHLHGYGGVGKTELLRALARERPEALLVGAEADEPSRIAEVLSTQPLVLIDEVRGSGKVDAWLRTQLSGERRFVVAGRDALAPTWRTDARCRAALEVVHLHGFSRAEAASFLTARGVPPARRELLVKHTHAHPLALALSCELGEGAARVDERGLWGVPGLVGSLLEVWLGDEMGRRRLLTLGAAAMVRRVTEALLRATMSEEEAFEAFEWLRRRSFVRVEPEGLAMHELVRECVLVDLAWRDRAVYDRLFGAVSEHVLNEFARRPGELGREVVELLARIEPFRSVVMQAAGLDWRAAPASEGERDALCAMVGAHEGPASLAIFERWWAHGATPMAIRDAAGELVGLCNTPWIDRGGSWRAIDDPAMARIASWIDEHGGDWRRALVLRHWLDRSLHQTVSPTAARTVLHLVEQTFAAGHVDFLFVVYVEPERWRHFADDPERDFVGTFVVEGREHGILVTPVAQLTPMGWLRRTFERAAKPPPPRDASVRLGRDEVLEAVREACRTLHDPRALEKSSLVQTSLLTPDQRRSPLAAADALAVQIRGAITALAESPATEREHAALHRTYLEPASKQRAAAFDLGMSFATYRRVLRRGLERVADRLWQRQAPDERSD